MDYNYEPDENDINNNQGLESVSDPAFNLPKNNQSNQGEAKQGDSSTKKAANLVGKGAATYFGGTAGAKMYDKSDEIPVLGDAKKFGVDTLANEIDKSPAGAKAAEILDKSGVLDAASKGLDAATGSSSKKDVGAEDPEPSGEATGTTNFKPNIFVIGAIALFLLFFGGIILIGAAVSYMTQTLAPLFKAEEVLNQVGDGFESFGEHLANLATGCGWTSQDECNEQTKFYDELIKVEKEFSSYGVNLDTTLIIATLTNDMTLESFDNGGSFDEESISEDDSDNYKNARKNIWILADEMAPVKINIEVDPITGIEYEERSRKLDMENYMNFLETKFIADYYFPGYEGNDLQFKIDSVLEFIEFRIDLYESLEDNEGNGSSITGDIYAECPGVTVTDNDYNVEEVLPLEDYIARVVQREIGGYTDDQEVLMAQAIAARTYTLVRTNNCSKPIRNSISDQTIADVAGEAEIMATQNTAGQVLVYEGDLILAEYDAYCYDDKTCEWGNEGDTLYVMYKKVPNGEEHKVTLSGDKYTRHIIGGHGRGMSQLVAWKMGEEQGFSHQEILEYFYSPGIQISNMSTSKGGEYQGNSVTPTSVEELLARSQAFLALGEIMIGNTFVDVSYIYSSVASNLGQCVWFARSRILEMILDSNMPDDVKEAAFNQILNTTGHGKDWYDNPALEVFTKSSDYTKPKVGAIVSWTSDYGEVGHNYGHVAIVEAVDYESGLVTISQSWNSTGADGVNNWDNVAMKVTTMTFEELEHYQDGYEFNGYVYALG